MKTPRQKLFIGDLVIGTKDHYWYFDKGSVGIVTHAFCHKVCIKGGDPSLSLGNGGPEYAMEWGYVGLFDGGTPQGVRLDRLSPVEVISGN